MLSSRLAGQQITSVIGKHTVRLASSSTIRSDGLRSTLPSTSKPESSNALRKNYLPKEALDGDRGYLAFTKSSLFKYVQLTRFISALTYSF